MVVSGFLRLRSAPAACNECGRLRSLRTFEDVLQNSYKKRDIEKFCFLTPKVRKPRTPSSKFRCRAKVMPVTVRLSAQAGTPAH